MKHRTILFSVFLLLTTSCATTWEEQFTEDLTAIWEPMLETLQSVQDTPSAIAAKEQLVQQLDRLDAHEKKSQSTKRPPSAGPGNDVQDELVALYAMILHQIDRINARADARGILKDTLWRVQQKRNWRYQGS